MRRFLEVFRVFLVLGCTCFGGPVAHIGYFRRELVCRRGWLDEGVFARLVALCQFLPGPASSQLGFSIGLLRAGWAGGAAAFVGFTLPSALLMGMAAVFLQPGVGSTGRGLIHGLKWVALAVVTHAVWGMARTLRGGWVRPLIALGTAGGALTLTEAWLQPLWILLGGILGAWKCQVPEGEAVPAMTLPHSRRTGLALVIIGILLGGVLSMPSGPGTLWALGAGFYRVGAMVFGGGHVLLPLLEDTVVRSGWVGQDVFLTGYGAAQVVPGPMFTLATFLGVQAKPGGWAGAFVATWAMFLPGLIWVSGALPWWGALASQRWAMRAMAGATASVVGLLAAALVGPVWHGAVLGPWDAVIGLLGFLVLLWGRVPVLGVVAGCVVAGGMLEWLAGY
jgi:chromate transporter